MTVKARTGKRDCDLVDQNALTRASVGDLILGNNLGDLSHVGCPSWFHCQSFVR